MKEEKDNPDYRDQHCPVTGRTDFIDDCYIEIQFGYGSDKDMWTYKFGPVHDMVGKALLDLIQSFMDTAKPPIGKSVDDFGEDTLAPVAAAVEKEWLALSKEERRERMIEWGVIDEDS
jgi:hypothetical protein